MELAGFSTTMYWIAYLSVVSTDTLLPSASTMLATNVLFTAMSALVLAYLTAAASLATTSSATAVRLYFSDTANTVILEPTYFSSDSAVTTP